VNGLRLALGRAEALTDALHRYFDERHWAVPSQTRASERYLVDVEGAACTCPDAELGGPSRPCKHQHAVLFWIAWGRDVDADGGVTETVAVRVQRKTYP